jgi:hypothetical protein
MSFEIHADYSRNGRLSTSTQEYSLRQQVPGAILLPNFDSDRRRLPRRVRSGSPVSLDYQMSTKMGRDNDLTPILVRATHPAQIQNADCFLRISGQRAEQIKVYDNAGRELNHRGTPVAAALYREYDLNFTTPNLSLKIEAGIFPGSPRSSRNLGYYPRGTPLRVRENLIRLELFCVQPGGAVQLEDWAYFSIAPLLFPDNSARARQFYIAELPENGAAVIDVERILRRIGGVPLYKVPATISNGDGWLQDQFQLGYTQSPAANMNVLLHLPRLRSNVVQSSLSPNLAGMITSHFPSRGLGVLQVFWNRTIAVAGTGGQSYRIPFKDSYPLLARMRALFQIRRFMVRELRARSSQNIAAAGGFSAVLRELPPLLQRLSSALDAERNQASEDAERNMLQQLKETYKQRVQEAVRHFSKSGSNIQLQLTTRQSATIPMAEADRLYVDLQKKHDGVNYGGNIEVFPATTAAPLGKIVIGNGAYEDGSSIMDPDLLNFLSAQGEQPVVEVDVTWLEVGHVDELLSFLKNRNGEPAICRASPGMALRILREAVLAYRRGLSTYDEYRDYYRPSGILDRKMDSGTTPVTHMLRGKQWLHHHPRRSLQELNPPWIYRSMARANAQWQGYSLHEIPYFPGEGDDRYYFSNISAFEFLYHETDKNNNSVNEFIENQFMKDLDGQIKRDFPNTKVYHLPVLFDAISDLNSWRNDRREDMTSAFTPNVVNMQHVNGHVLVPRPYGPRMQAAAALALLQKVFQDTSQSNLMRGVNLRWFRSKRLDKTWFWVKSRASTTIFGPGGTIPLGHTFGRMQSARDVAEWFRDGFPGESLDEVERRIRNANRRSFDRNGYLRSGWQKIAIPENTVDLFEAYTQIVLEQLGQQVHWVDSWFYHVRLGEIHCGSNVIRRPALNRQNAWWNVQPGQ